MNIPKVNLTMAYKTQTNNFTLTTKNVYLQITLKLLNYKLCLLIVQQINRYAFFIDRHIKNYTINEHSSMFNIEITVIIHGFNVIYQIKIPHKIPDPRRLLIFLISYPEISYH